MKNLNPRKLIIAINTFFNKQGKLVFALLIIAAYIFLLGKMMIYKNSTVTVDQQNNSQTLSIDKNTVDKLNSLKDNSVDVQAIFNEARNNPF